MPAGTAAAVCESHVTHRGDNEHGDASALEMLEHLEGACGGGLGEERGEEVERWRGGEVERWRGKVREVERRWSQEVLKRAHLGEAPSSPHGRGAG